MTLALNVSCVACVDNTVFPSLSRGGFRADSVADFVAKAKSYTIEGIAEQVRCAYPVLEAEGDMFFQGHPRRVFDALQTPK